MGFLLIIMTSMSFVSVYSAEGQNYLNESGIGPFGRRYLALNRSLHAELRNMEMVMGQANDQKVIFRKFDKDWKVKCSTDGYEYICGIIRDHNGRYRMYYNVFQHVYNSEEKKTRRREAMAVAYSDDGVDWVRPALNIAPAIVDHPSSNLINIEPHPGMNEKYYYRAGPVFFEEDAPEESRYKLSWRVGHNIYVATSSDGLNFITQGNAINHKADTQHSAFYDPLRSKYVMYGRKRNDWETGPRDRRGVVLHSSENWTDVPWSNVGLVVIDPMDVWDYSKQVRPEVYTPSIQYYHGQYIGLPSIFFIDTTRHLVTDPDVNTGLYYPIVIYSHDGINWRFPDLNHSVIALEPHEHVSTYKQASFKGKEPSTITSAPNFIEIDDRLLIYYTVRTGNYEEHRFDRDPGSINVAFMRVDGFASIRTKSSGSEPGEWVTSELQVPSGTESLRVNAKVHGSMQVEILDPISGKPFNGLELARSVAVTGDKINFIMKWQDGAIDNVAGQSVRIRFVIVHGEIFSFSFQPD